MMNQIANVEKSL